MGSPRRSHRLIPLAVACALLALTLGGCVVFKVEPTASQNQVLGSVRIVIVGCASNVGGSPPPGSCDRRGNAEENAPDGAKTQLLLTFRLPLGALAPSSFTSTSTGPNNPGPQLQFNKSPSLTTTFQQRDPAPAGQEWVGYISQVFTYQNSGEQNFIVQPEFGLPAGADGAPFKGPFLYRPVLGARNYNGGGTPDPNEPVSCGSTLTLGHLSGSGENYNTICADAPRDTELDSVFLLPTRDAGLVGQGATAPAGSTANVPFTLRYAGSSTAAASFSFAGTTGVPGAAATPSPGVLTPASDSTNTVNVAVPLAASTTPGTYDVTLTAALSDGEKRVAHAQLNVLPPLCVVPKLKGKTKSQAKTLLVKANCTLGKVKKKASKKRTGRVISQTPGRGTALPNGSKVAIVVASGSGH